MVASCDAHYVTRDDADAHEALLAIQTRDLLSNPNRFRFDTKEFYLKSGAEMAAALPDFLGALPVSVEIAERCAGLELSLGDPRLPRFPVPEGTTPSSELERLCREGMTRRYGAAPPAEAEERLRFEIDVIEEMGFSSYFLIVWDYIRWAREHGVAVGPGRGSAAGSLVSYCLRITDLDPLAHGLLFERFLNPGRKSLPDIDTDFAVGGRDAVVRYVTEKYGSEAVARIGTFGKLLARAVVRDAGRVLGHTYGQVDRIAKLVPERPIGIRLEDAMRPGGELAAAYEADEVTRQVIDTARPLEGLVRNEGVHAAGVVIAPGAVTDFLPVRVDDEGNVVTQVPDHDVEDLGLLKMDFLGLRNLDVIQDCLALIERGGGGALDIEAVALDDEPTYRDAGPRRRPRGVPVRVARACARRCARWGPTEFADLVALVALYRPGPMAFIGTYARNKRDPSLVAYDDPRLEPITGPTHGVAIYQESLMSIAREIAAFSPARADDLRKAVGKKDKVLMASLKDEFIAGLPVDRHQARRRQPALGPVRGGRRLLVQQGPRRLLRPAGLPHGLPQGQPPGRVHGRAALVGHGHQGPRAVLRLRLRGDGPRRAAPGRQRQRGELRGDRRARDPLRADRREGRGGGRRRRDPRRPRRPRARSRRSGTSAAGWTRPRSTSGPWRASSAAARSTPPGPAAAA